MQERYTKYITSNIDQENHLQSRRTLGSFVETTARLLELQEAPSLTKKDHIPIRRPYILFIYENGKCCNFFS